MHQASLQLKSRLFFFVVVKAPVVMQSFVFQEGASARNIEYAWFQTMAVERYVHTADGESCVLSQMIDLFKVLGTFFPFYF